MELLVLNLLKNGPRYVYVAKDIIHSVWGGYAGGNPVLIKNGCIVCARRSKQIMTSYNQ